MTEETLTRFRNELNSFFILVFLNLVFGALAVAFGVQFIVTSVLGLTGGQSVSVLRIVAGSISMVSFGLGIAWIISSAEIFEGIEEIRTELKSWMESVSDETITSGIVRMMAHYRENRKTIRTMILVCTLGGFCFLALGIINSVEFFSLSLSSGNFTLNNYLLIPSALLTLGVALVSLLSSYYFSKFSQVWDLRVQETERSEDELKKSLGIDKE
ncbi:MAG: hypothetical protein LUQ40_04710 [Methanomicrobiales archaeon]|nr:hypothetical protein [Methanomicrobiales archaeon]